MAGLLSFVAINTLVFLGLAVAKAVPWPPPIPPHVLRAAVSHGGDSAADHLTAPQRALIVLVALLARLRAGIR
jgi:hypothetical protein